MGVGSDPKGTATAIGGGGGGVPKPPVRDRFGASGIRDVPYGRSWCAPARMVPVFELRAFPVADERALSSRPSKPGA